jgi:hypothetical protein
MLDAGVQQSPSQFRMLLDLQSEAQPHVRRVFIAQGHDDHVVPMPIGEELRPHRRSLGTDRLDDPLVVESEGLEQCLGRAIRPFPVIDGIQSHVAEVAVRLGDFADQDHCLDSGRVTWKSLVASNLTRFEPVSSHLLSFLRGTWDHRGRWLASATVPSKIPPPLYSSGSTFQPFSAPTNSNTELMKE